MTNAIPCTTVFLNHIWYFNLQHIQNALARAVAAAHRSSNPDHILRSLHWLKVQECTEYKVIFTTYKLLQSSSPRYQHSLIITVQPSCSTRSSTFITLLQSQVHSSLKITNCCFRHAARHLWNKLPHSLISLVHHHHPALLICQALILDQLLTFLMIFSNPVLKPLFLNFLNLEFCHSMFGNHWR